MWELLWRPVMNCDRRLLDEFIKLRSFKKVRIAQGTVHANRPLCYIVEAKIKEVSK